jgi:hypothetical protein
MGSGQTNVDIPSKVTSTPTRAVDIYGPTFGELDYVEMMQELEERRRAMCAKSRRGQNEELDSIILLSPMVRKREKIDCF